MIWGINLILEELLQLYIQLNSKKRVLPHSYIILFLDPKDKCPSPTGIDCIIMIEVPYPNEDMIAYEVVKQFMMHGSSGSTNPKSPCIMNDKCTKKFQKDFYEKTTSDEECFSIYRRQNNGRIIEKNEIILITNMICLIF